MTNICPTITATDIHTYKEQMEFLKPFASRLHIDCMDGDFAPSVSQALSESWWYDNQIADFHLMYRRPEESLPALIELKPSLVIFHYEAEVDHLKLAADLQANGIMAGLALLQDTSVDTVSELLPSFDHVLVFSGHLGYHGGQADMGLLDKVKQIKLLVPDIEIGWDGGINAENAAELIASGVDVLNVGGYIHNSTDPEQAYAKLEALAR